MEMSKFAVLADQLKSISHFSHPRQSQQGSSIPMEPAMVSRGDHQHRHCPGRLGVAPSATWRLAGAGRGV